MVVIGVALTGLLVLPSRARLLSVGRMLSIDIRTSFNDRIILLTLSLSDYIHVPGKVRLLHKVVHKSRRKTDDLNEEEREPEIWRRKRLLKDAAKEVWKGAVYCGPYESRQSAEDDTYGC